MCVCVHVCTQNICVFCIVCVCAQLYLTLCDPMDCSPLGSSVHGISQARILEWVAISSSRGSSRPKNWTRISCSAGRFFTTEPPEKPACQDSPWLSSGWVRWCLPVASTTRCTWVNTFGEAEMQVQKVTKEATWLKMTPCHTHKILKMLPENY